MLKILKNFLDFSGEENKKKFIASIWLGVLGAFGNALKIPAVMIILMGILNGGNIATSIIWSLVIMVISIVLGIIAKDKGSLLQTDAGYGCCAYKRIEMAEHLRFVPMGYFNNNTVGEITSVITNTMDNLSNSATRVIMVSTQGMLETAMALIFLFLFDWRIGFVGLIGFALYLLINLRLQKSSEKVSKEKEDADTNLVSETVEYLKGIAEVKSYGLFGKSAKKFDAANEASRKANTAMEMQFSPWFFVQDLLLRLTGVVIVALSVVFCLQGTMDLVIAIGMMVSAFLLFSGLEMYGNFSSLLHLAQGYMDKANAVLDLPVMDIDGRDIAPEKETIVFQDVDFAYDEKKIIDDVTLTIPEKKTTALVGPSGGGKTTLAHLAARFWDVDRGSVSLGGMNVKNYNFDSLMKNFSFVFQNVYLFADTIENNIKFGKTDATHEEVMAAAKAARCDEFIRKLPDGYETVIGEGGASLSGGEKQRLSIARAIMKDSPIIILDEATSNVDPENEEDLMEAIRALTKDKTVIMIAHRLKTVRRADKIVVIAKGKVDGEGTHEELVKSNDIYRSFIEAREHVVNWKIG